MKSKSRTVEEERYYDYPGTGFRYNETLIDGDVVAQWFTRKGCDKKYTYSPNVLAWLYEAGHAHYDDDLVKEVWGYFDADVKLKDVENFSEWENVWCNSTGHDGFLYNIMQEEPVSTTFTKDYIGGYTNFDYDLDKCLAHLRAIPWVANAVIEEIPYYNRERYRTKGLRFDVTPPQEDIERLYHKYKKDPHWSCRVRDEFGCSYGNKEDLLGLNQFKLPKEVIEIKEQDRYED